MKSIFTSILLFVSSAVFAFGTDMTNGAFFVDAPVECHLIFQNGVSRTNQLGAGKTYIMPSTIAEMLSTKGATFQLSGLGLVDASSNSLFSIDLFEQEVKNLDALPRRAEFGGHNVNLTLSRGEFSIIYSNAIPDSSVLVSTPYATYQLHGGKYFFRLNERAAVAFVMDGMMTVHGEKDRKDVTKKGELAIAVPSGDDKIITGIKALKPEERERLSVPILQAEKKCGDVMFIVIAGRVIGVLLK
jgi:hypothetical protein